VETAKELSVLEPLHADIFQGSLFDKPRSAADIYSKYIDTSSDMYKERASVMEEIIHFKERFGTVHFDAKKILGANEIGLWVIRLDTKQGRYGLYVDTVMEHALGLTEGITPEECYDYWYNRISKSDKPYLDTAVYGIMKNQRALELTYGWNHPEKGKVRVHSSGICTFNDGVKIVLEGILRVEKND
jgi:hypothetical protein